MSARPGIERKTGILPSRSSARVGAWPSRVDRQRPIKIGMKASERATGPRIESRYLGAAPSRAGSGREEGADAVLVLAELRAKLDALLERDPVTPARRDSLHHPERGVRPGPPVLFR